MRNGGRINANLAMWLLGSRLVVASLAVAGTAAGVTSSAVQPEAPKPWIPTAAPATPPADARCLIPMGDPIPADTVLAALREGRNVDLQGKIIEGSLDANRYWGVAGERTSSLRVVRGKLRLDSCRVTGQLSFPRAVFVQDVILSCAEIVGDVDLSDSEVRGSLLADRAHIAGDVRLTNTNVEKELSFRKSVLGARLDMSGARLHAINMQESEIARSFDVVDSIAGAADLTLAKISGPVRLKDVLLLGVFNARDATIVGSLTLSSVTSSASIDLSGGSIGGDASLIDLSVENNLLLRATFGGAVDLTTVAVGQNLSLAGSQFVDVKIAGLTVRGASDLQRSRYAGRLEIGDSDFGTGFSATGAHISGHCEFRRVRFAGDDPMAGVHFAVPPSMIETRLPGFPVVDPGSAMEPEPDPSGDDEP